MSTQTDKIRGALMIAAADSGASRMVRSWAVDALSALSELEAQPAQDAWMTEVIRAGNAMRDAFTRYADFKPGSKYDRLSAKTVDDWDAATAKATRTPVTPPR